MILAGVKARGALALGAAGAGGLPGCLPCPAPPSVPRAGAPGVTVFPARADPAEGRGVLAGALGNVGAVLVLS